MKVIVLGTAAGGGVPQWNCACQVCQECRGGAIAARRQDCLAVSPDGRWWTLVNASPDIRAQLLDAAPLGPGPGPRDIPITGVLLTDAELDHMMGLLMLRECDGLPVWGPLAAMRALDGQFGEVLRGYGDWSFSTPGDTVAGLSVDTFAVSHKRPKYARDEDIPGDWVVAYRFTDPNTGGSVVYAPCLADWPDGFDDFLAGADCALLDGTFYSPAEMSGTGVDAGRQRAMGHVPIAGENGSLARRRVHPGTRWIYTHLNNTNPVADPGGAEYAAVVAAGAEVVDDGTQLLI